MINRTFRHLPSCRPRRGRGRAGSTRLALGCLALLTGLGCYRATGFQRNAVAAEVIPAAYGDRVLGLKAKGGQGDYYLGNDFVQVDVDGTVYGDTLQAPLAGAASGGSIVDAGYIQLDSSYNRVSTPGSVMHRLTPVVNQDPDMQVVFDSYQLATTSAQASLTMSGRILDPSDRLGTGASPVSGVAVTHTLTVSQLDRFLTVTTVVTNNTSGTLPIRNVGDCLVQQGGGYAFNVPANFDYQGNALATRWGVVIPSYSDFTYSTGTPLTTSVQAAMVGLMNTEPGADTVDSHCSLGLLPLDADRLLVAADPQDLLYGGVASMPNRPVFPARLVAGSLPVSSLASGQSLTYHRRLYLLGGASVDTGLVGGLPIAANYPNSANGLLNLLDLARYSDSSVRPVQDLGTLTFTLSGNAQRQGPQPTEIRIERNVAGSASATPVWQVQRVEWLEPNENLVTRTALAPSTLSVKLPVGTYRMVLTSLVNGAKAVQTRTTFHNLNAYDDASGRNQVGLAQALEIEKDQEFKVNTQDLLCPGTGYDDNFTGTLATSTYSLHYFTTREADGTTYNMQPLRITFLNADGTPAASMRRMRTLASRWGASENQPVVASGVIPGQYQFRGGNEMYGGAFTGFLPVRYAWFLNDLTYTVYGTRGPLSELTTLTTGSSFKAYNGQTDTSHTLTVTPRGLPTGWTSFDLPGPGQASTGGTLPMEKLVSGMANGVQVVGATEQDVQVDGSGLYNKFRAEYYYDGVSDYDRPASLSAIDRPASTPCGLDPFVVAGRTSTLASYGTVTTLFTSTPTSARLGGAADSTGWTLADFLYQGQGQFTIVHRPRAPLPGATANAQVSVPDYTPAGLFTRLGAPDYAVTDTSRWWNQTGPLAFGKKNGDFDAIELLRGQGLDAAAPAQWFTEFTQVRADWFAMLNVQSPAWFTKALGLSSSRFTLDTPVGLARTYLKAQPTTQDDLSGVLAALQSGAAVASTGPFLDVSVGGVGPGGFVPGPVATATLAINLWTTDWMPVDQIRVVVNGAVVKTLTPAELSASGSDSRLYTGSVAVPMPTGGKDAWIVVEAGVPLTIDTSTAYAPSGTPWSAIMRGIYPIAVTNPIFVGVTATTKADYQAPGN
jgi:hypothetical protein